MTPISAHAETRRSDYQFERTQSRQMAAREWEDRIPMLKAWSKDIAAAIAILCLMAVAFPVADMLARL